MSRWMDWLARPRARVSEAGAFVEALAAKSAFLSQKCTIEYCRARAGLNWDKLFREEMFLEAVERCRWESYAILLGDVAETTQVLLRRRLLPEHARDSWLAEAAEAALLTYPVPAYRVDWQDRIDQIDARLIRTGAAPARPVHEIPIASARAVFDLLPIHSSVRAHDLELVQNALRFQLCRIFEDLVGELDLDALAAVISAGARDAVPRP